ncbi:MAG: endonuclease domain-containing protein [Chloroflexota bacterium]
MPKFNLITGQKINPVVLQRAKELRRDMTLAEKRLWTALRRNQLDGFRFRRQQIIGRYIVDFYCDAARLIVEVDGSVHNQQIEYDQAREHVLRDYELRILRFSNEEIMKNLENVLSEIRTALQPTPPSPRFSPPLVGDRTGERSDSPLRKGEGPGEGS